MHVYIDTCMDIANAMVFMYVPGVFWLVQSFPLRYIQALMKIQDPLRTSRKLGMINRALANPVDTLHLFERGWYTYIYIYTYLVAYIIYQDNL